MSVLIQNLTIPADNDLVIELDVTPLTSIDTLESSQIFWDVYEQQYGVPVAGIAAVLSKSNLSGFGGIVILPSPPMTALVTINRADTIALLRNYYHETTVIDAYGDMSTVNCGILTVSPTENRP